MTNPVSMVRGEVTESGGPRIRESLVFWCPGCDKLHRIVFWQKMGESGPVWEWDQNLEAPTISPSILVTWTYGGDKVAHTCHSFLRAGRWEFLTDCTHDLAGQTVDMVPLPDWMVAE